jgi:hypothetical protein
VVAENLLQITPKPLPLRIEGRWEIFVNVMMLADLISLCFSYFFYIGERKKWKEELSYS